MMEFGAPQWLRLEWLTGVLILLGICGLWFRRRRVRKWGDSSLWHRLAPGQSPWLRMARYLTAVLAFGFAVLAAARPQVPGRLVQIDRQGIDVVVALDVSLSMEVTDVVPNRLARSRQEIRELFEGLRGNRLGVTLFSGSSFLLCPLTVDIGAANLFLDAVEPDVLPNPGTNLEEALRGALRAFGTDETQTRGRAIVLFTDGEGHDGDPKAVLETLKKEGIPVISVGVGTPGGEPIPMRDDQGNVVGYKKDRRGQVVLSQLDEMTLRNLAEATGGIYLPATLQGREIEAIHKYLAQLEQGELGEAFRLRMDEKFQIPAGVSLVLLALALLTPEALRVRETS